MLRSQNNKTKTAKTKIARTKQRQNLLSAMEKIGISIAPTFPSAQFQGTNRYGGKVVTEAVLLADMLD